MNATVLAFGSRAGEIRSTSSPTWSKSPVGGAVIATYATAMAAYLKGAESFRFTYSVGKREYRTPENLNTIKEQLIKLFGPHVTVAIDEGYPLGVTISIYFS